MMHRRSVLGLAAVLAVIAGCQSSPDRSSAGMLSDRPSIEPGPVMISGVDARGQPIHVQAPIAGESSVATFLMEKLRIRGMIFTPEGHVRGFAVNGDDTDFPEGTRFRSVTFGRDGKVKGWEFSTASESDPGCDLVTVYYQGIGYKVCRKNGGCPPPKSCVINYRYVNDDDFMVYCTCEVLNP
jgi:hypothetical protein